MTRMFTKNLLAIIVLITATLFFTPGCSHKSAAGIENDENDEYDGQQIFSKHSCHKIKFRYKKI